ncbi:MAG: hypothetical protein WC977_08520 [Anaerovoracaceae bacterium]
MKQELRENNCSFEPDSSPDAWEYYKGYASCILIGEPELAAGGNRPKAKAKFKGIEIKVAGDCSFNFKLCKTYFEKIIEKARGPEKDTELGVKLVNAASMHHKLPNFGLMPVAGGLNNLKGALKIKDNKVMVHDIGKRPASALDRLDTFIYFLDYSFKMLETFHSLENAVDLRGAGEFFSESVFTTSMKGENFTILYDLIASFEDIYEYCEIFYGLKMGTEKHKQLIDRLIKNGNKPIDSVEDIVRYIELANEFWDARKFPPLHAVQR